jgi:hypothetical protein
VRTWGPPVRTCSSIPEIVHIRLTLQPDS